MNRKTKTALGLLVGVGVLLVGVGLASASTPKKKPKTQTPENDEDVIVHPPNAQGVPDGTQPPIIVLPPKSETTPRVPTTAPTAPIFVPSPGPTSIPDEVFPPTEDPRGPDAMSQSPPQAPPPAVPVSVKIGPAIIDEEQSEADKLVEKFTKEVLPPGTKVSPLAAEEVKPALDPNGTILLARTLLSREVLPNWKDDFKEEVKVWQKKVGLKPDGLFGVVSVSRMAEEVGILPLVRYWSKSYPTKAKALEDYTARILDVATKLQKFLPDAKHQILALGKSVEREKGKTFSANPGPNPTLAEVDTINQFLAKEAKADGVKELNV